MKNKLYILLLFLSSTLVSCDDYLDVPPKNIITVQNINDIKILVGNYLEKTEKLSGTGYQMFKPVGGLTGQDVFREFEDNLDFSGLIYLSYFEDLQFQWRYDSFEYGVWTGLYENIGSFNLFLYEIDQLGDNTGEMKAIKAEVLMNRALHYLRLVQYFCPYRAGQYVADPERYGLPIMTGVEELSNNHYPSRLNQKETYEFILNDLMAAEELAIDPTDFNLVYNKRALYGLMAEFYMWRAESPAKEVGDWESARNYAEKSINGHNLVGDLNGLEALFNPAAASSTSALRLTMVNRISGAKYSEYYNSPWDVRLVRDAVYDMYDTDDIRRDFYINGGTKRVEKFNLADDAGKIILPMWRVAEMKLIIAESYIREGDSGNALTYLNEFKQSRISGFTSYTGDEILDEIIKERRKEFLCEPNYRWLDMKRNGLTYSRTTSEGVTHTLEADDYRYTFRIPTEGELENNPNNFQNPHWDSVEEKF